MAKVWIESSCFRSSPGIFGQPHCAVSNFEDGNVDEELLEYSDHIVERIARVAKDANLVVVADRGCGVGAGLGGVVQEIPAEDGAPEEHSLVVLEQGGARGHG